MLQDDKFDLQLSISQSNLDLNLGEQQGLDAQGNATQLFKSYMLSEWTTFSFGIKSKKQPFYFSVGLTNKKSIQALAFELTEGEQGSVVSKDDFYDLGFRFVIDDYSYKDVLGLTYSLGYSKSNIGDFISFIDGQSDPAPRVARLGMSLGLKFKPFINKDWVLAVTHIHEAEDLLIKTIPGESYIYDNGFGISEKLHHNSVTKSMKKVVMSNILKSKSYIRNLW